MDDRDVGNHRLQLSYQYNHFYETFNSQHKTLLTCTNIYTYTHMLVVKIRNIRLNIHNANAYENTYTIVTSEFGTHHKKYSTRSI